MSREQAVIFIPKPIQKMIFSRYETDDRISCEASAFMDIRVDTSQNIVTARTRATGDSKLKKKQAVLFTQE
eukprot:5603365-Karenia_brevis.AAC.2